MVFSEILLLISVSLIIIPSSSTLHSWILNSTPLLESGCFSFNSTIFSSSLETKISQLFLSDSRIFNSSSKLVIFWSKLLISLIFPKSSRKSSKSLIISSPINLPKLFKNYKILKKYEHFYIHDQLI